MRELVKINQTTKLNNKGNNNNNILLKVILINNNKCSKVVVSIKYFDSNRFIISNY